MNLLGLLRMAGTIREAGLSNPAVPYSPPPPLEWCRGFTSNPAFLFLYKQAQVPQKKYLIFEELFYF
jgi:hypothetical protein